MRELLSPLSPCISPAQLISLAKVQQRWVSATMFKGENARFSHEVLLLMKTRKYSHQTLRSDFWFEKQCVPKKYCEALTKSLDMEIRMYIPWPQCQQHCTGKHPPRWVLRAAVSLSAAVEVLHNILHFSPPNTHSVNNMVTLNYTRNTLGHCHMQWCLMMLLLLIVTSPLLRHHCKNAKGQA